MRSSRLKLILFMSTLAALPLAFGGQNEDPTTQRPDVVLVILDDVNDWVTPLGGPARTPGLSRLAERSLVFTNAHCSAPLCRPSREQMMAGRRRQIEGASAESHGWGTLLTEHFARNGYRVLGAGKVFHGEGSESREERRRGHPQRFRHASIEKHAGFDDYFVSPVRPTPDRPVRDLVLDDTAAKLDWQALDIHPSETPDYQAVSWVAEQLREADSQPLLIVVGLVGAHLPWYVPARYFDLHPIEAVELPATREQDLDDVPAKGHKLALDNAYAPEMSTQATQREAVRAYLAAVSFVDDQLRRLLDVLEESRRGADAVLVVTSDHGFHLGEKGHWRKSTLWEDAAHVPLLIAAPGFDPGVSAKPVDLVSLYATLCELAGLPTPESVEGPSLTPLLTDPMGPWDHVAITFKPSRDVRVLDKPLAITEMMIPISKDQTPPYIFVRCDGRVRAFCKYGCQTVMALQAEVGHGPD